MPQLRPLPCSFYRTASGNEPVREWLKELPEFERKQVGSDIKAVQFGWPLGLPLVDSPGRWPLGGSLQAADSNRADDLHGPQRNDHPSQRLHQKDRHNAQDRTRYSPKEKT